MDDPAEYALALKALTECPSNCVRWKRGLFERVLGDPDLKGVHPNDVKRLAAEVARSPGALKQRRETDEEYRDDYEFFYYVVVPYAGIARGIFVKCVLLDDDEELPQVLLVSIHQSSP